MFKLATFREILLTLSGNVIIMSCIFKGNMRSGPFAKDLNFSITCKTLPNKDIIAAVEDAVKDLEKEEADRIRAK